MLTLKNRKILEIRIGRLYFNKNYRKRDNYEIYSVDFSLYYVVKGDEEKGKIIVKRIVNREKMDKIIEMINESFDVVLCDETATAFLIQFVMLKRGLKLIPFIIGNFDNFRKTKTLCEWIEKTYKENPFEEIIKLPTNFWFCSSQTDLKSLVNFGVDKKRIFYFPTTAYLLTEILSDITVKIQNIKVNLKAFLIKEIYGNIIACGNNKRDYNTLVTAANNLPYDIHIFCDSHFFEPDFYSNNIKVHNYVPLKKFYEILQISKFVVIPLIDAKESIGIATAGLAISFGKPIIATNFNYMRDYVINGYNGILVEPYNAKALKEAILFLCENPKELEKMEKNSYILYQKLDEITKKNFRAAIEKASKINKHCRRSF